MGKVRTAAAAALSAAVGVAAHGHVNNLIVNGVSYPGCDVTSYPYIKPVPLLVGWSSTNTDNGFVAPDAFAKPDVICHRDGKNADGYVTVKAGDSITFQWDTWPESHHGPVVDYLAPCPNDRCDTVDKTALKFFKIAEVGRLDMALPGRWAADVLIENGFQWTTQIPVDVKPGHYVLRHSILALHAAGNPNGAQDYPYCFNLHITGSGSAAPAGTAGQSLMTENEPGVLYDLYSGPKPYEIPGPPLMDGASSSVAQAKVAATASAAPSPYSGGGGNGSGGTTTAPATTTVPTTLTTSTTSASSGGGAGGSCASMYGQCGGIGWNGPTCCNGGSCKALNSYYSQCVTS